METLLESQATKNSELCGRYVYCIVPDIGKETWGPIGLDGAQVRAIGYGDLCALVHDCPTEPYQGDDATVKAWVWTHSEVVDAAWEATDSVLPMTFDCIVRPAEGHGADETVAAWLRAEYDGFRSQLAALKGRVELGVQVFWQVEAVTRAVVTSNEEVGQLQAEMAGKPKGMAYFYQQKIERALKGALEAKADGDYRRDFAAITALTEDVRVNKLKRPADGKQMLLNLAVLMPRARVGELGALLDELQQEEGIEVRFTGPWPPYSFVAKREHTNSTANM